MFIEFKFGWILIYSYEKLGIFNRQHAVIWVKKVIMIYVIYLEICLIWKQNEIKY